GHDRRRNAAADARLDREPTRLEPLGGAVEISADVGRDPLEVARVPGGPDAEPHRCFRKGVHEVDLGLLVPGQILADEANRAERVPGTVDADQYSHGERSGFGLPGSGR